MEESTLSTDAQLLDELRRACVEKRTGKMLIVTQDNQLARISFREGEIVSISYRLKSGREAIALLREIKQARVKFSPGSAGGDQAAQPLPSTVEIVRLLSGDNAAPASASGIVAADQVPGALKIIEAELIEFLGPLASIVWTEHCERLATPVTTGKLRALLEDLAKEIGDPTKVQLFKEQVWRKINGARNAPS